MDCCNSGFENSPWSLQTSKRGACIGNLTAGVCKVVGYSNLNAAVEGVCGLIPGLQFCTSDNPSTLSFFFLISDKCGGRHKPFNSLYVFIIFAITSSHSSLNQGRGPRFRFTFFWNSTFRRSMYCAGDVFISFGLELFNFPQLALFLSVGVIVAFRLEW